MSDILCKSGIYAITNKISGKKYIGSAVSLNRRFKEHINLLESGRHHSITLQRAWCKYGSTAFVYSVLEIVSDRGLLIQCEQKWIDAEGSIGKNGYNISPTAGSPLGVKHSKSARLNMRIAHLGKTLPESQKLKISLAGIGRTQSKETIAKRVATRRANGSYKQSKESLKKMVETRRLGCGFSHTEENRLIMSEAAKKRWNRAVPEQTQGQTA